MAPLAEPNDVRKKIEQDHLCAADLGTTMLASPPLAGKALSRDGSDSAHGHRELNSMVFAIAEHGCRKSFWRLYDLTSARLFGIICRINRERGEAEEVLQETYVKVWSRCGQFEDRKSVV